MGIMEDSEVPVIRVSDPKHHNAPWRLRFFVDGKAKRKFFPSREAAVGFFEGIQRDRRKDKPVIHSWKRSEWEEFQDAKKEAGGRDLREVVSEWREVGGTAFGVPDLTTAVRMFLSNKEGLDRSPHTIRPLKARLNAMVRSFKGRPVASLRRNELLDWIMELKVEAKTVTNYKNDLGNFFNWCVRREWIRGNPLALVGEDDLPRIVKKPVGILSIPECRRLLRWVEASDLDRIYLPWFALRMFAGVRREESLVFRWEWVDREQHRLIIPAAICKTRDDWVIDDLEPNVWQWMGLSKKTNGPIDKPSKRRLAKILQEAKITWSRNAFRHTYATMHLSAFRDAARTSVPMRHRNSQRLYHDYLGKLLPKKEAMGYFGLTPVSPGRSKPQAPSGPEPFQGT